MTQNRLVLQNILGAKAKVAVLREVVRTPGITARQVAESSGMSWGSIRPAVEYLKEIEVIKKRRADFFWFLDPL